MLSRQLICCLLVMVIAAGGTMLLSGAAVAAPTGAVPMAAPGSICGYADHALDQMQERKISSFDVELTVALGGSSAFQNRHGNWQYESGNVAVVLNDAGCVITVMHL